MIKARKTKEKSNPELEAGKVYRVTKPDETDYFECGKYFTYSDYDNGVIQALQSEKLVVNEQHLHYSHFEHLTGIEYVEVVLEEVEEL